MPKIRTNLVTAAADFLDASNSPIKVLRDCEDDIKTPPYVIFRIGGAENMFPGQADVWDMTLLCAVEHDADATTSEQAEREAEEVFALMDSCGAFKAFAACSIKVSAFESITTELAIVDGHWQHIAGYRVICSNAN